jgi:hypothetical protein
MGEHRSVVMVVLNMGISLDQGNVPYYLYTYDLLGKEKPGGHQAREDQHHYRLLPLCNA